MSDPYSPAHQQRLLRYFEQVRKIPSDRPAQAFHERFQRGEEEGIPAEGSAPALLPPARPINEESVARMLTSRQQQAAREEAAFESFTLPSPGLTDETIRTAQNVVTKLVNGDPLTAREALVLEEVILPGERPVIDVTGGTYQTPAFPFEFLGRPRERELLEAALPAIGRVELPQDPLRPFGGTAFFVGEGLLLTNRHVAQLFASGHGHPGSGTLSYRPGAAALDTRREVHPSGTPEPAPVLLEVEDVALIHPYWDAAVLAVRAPLGAAMPRPLTLASVRPAGPLESRYVVTVGYPHRNPFSNVEVQDREFRGIYGRKRLLPGLLGMVRNGGREPLSRFAPLNRPEVEALTHDCSTLTGNSGSAILDLLTGEVIGLHFAGQYLLTNWAVPAWELARDPYLRALGFRFSPVPEDAPEQPDPEWLRYWDTYRGSGPTVYTRRAARSNPAASETGTPAPAAPGPPLPAPASLGLTPAAAPEAVSPTAWYEQTDDAAIAAELQDHPAETARRLYAVLPPAEADALIRELTLVSLGEPTVESVALEESFLSGLFGRRADPALPEIVFIHGILGGHLARTAGMGGRLWINPLAFFAGDLAERLSLDPDGVREATSGQVLKPDGMLRLTYARASRTWRNAGFVVNEFSYDWRKPIEALADSLHRFIEELAAQRPHKRFALVAHSMGGLVACLYAARHREWSDRVESAVLLGSPLHGSYASMQAVLGTYDTLKKLAFLSRNDTVRDFQLMACSLSGLLDMLPDPAVFGDAHPLYRTNGWPDPQLAPSELHLKRSRALKGKISGSPLLTRAYLVVSQRHPTVANLFGTANTRGDGTVPLRSAGAVNAPEVGGRFLARNLHAELPQEIAVITAVQQLVRSGTCSLPVLTLADLAADAMPHAEAVAAEEAVPNLAPDVHALRERFRTGSFTQTDWNWLLAPGALPT